MERATGPQPPKVDLPEEWEEMIDELAGPLQERFVAVRRHLHAHPELSGEERATARFLHDQLRAAGLDAQLAIHDTAVVADLHLGHPSHDAPLIALRADTDALRVNDEKHVEYASQRPGVAHACGHDAHSAVIMGIGLLCRELIEREAAVLERGLRLRLIFQPAEETCQGARWLTDAGVMTGVDWILALHVDPERVAGAAGVRYGTLTANCDEVELVVEGRGGHAARPHHCVDPVHAAAQLVNALYAHLPRSVDCRLPSVFTVGQIHTGAACNVIPDKAIVHGTLRSTDQDVRETLKRRIHEISTGIEQISGTQIAVRFLNSLHSVDNHLYVAGLLETACARVLGPDNVERLEHPSLGGEDFSVYLEYAPGAMLRLGCARPGQTAYFLHSPKFDIDERILTLGARILLRTAVMLSSEPHRYSSR